MELVVEQHGESRVSRKPKHELGFEEFADNGGVIGDGEIGSNWTLPFRAADQLLGAYEDVSNAVIKQTYLRVPVVLPNVSYRGTPETDSNPFKMVKVVVETEPKVPGGPTGEHEIVIMSPKDSILNGDKTQVVTTNSNLIQYCQQYAQHRRFTNGTVLVTDIAGNPVIKRAYIDYDGTRGQRNRR